MSKKLINAICACIMIVCVGICAIGYVVGNPKIHWWIFVFVGALVCAMVSILGKALRK